MRGNPAPDPYDSLVASWLETHRSANTRSAYGADLATFGRWCARQDALPLRITAEDIVAYQVARTAAGDSPATVRRRASSLSSFFDFAVAADALQTNPVVGTARPIVAPGDPSPTQALADDHVAEHLRIAADSDNRLHALVALLALDGLKLNEALALDVEDISGRPPRVSATVSRSLGDERLMLHPESSRAVRRCIDGRRSGPLFVTVRGSEERRLTRFGADHLIKRLPNVDGTAITANALRRYYVTSSHASGVELDAIRSRAGLRDVRTARRYLTNSNPPAGRGSGRRPNDKEV